MSATNLNINRAILIESELNALFEVGKVLSRSIKLQDTLQAVLQALHDYADMQYGMVTLRDEMGNLSICTVYSDDKHLPANTVRYRAGEGIIGTIMETGKTIVLEHIVNDSRFLDRLGLYDLDLPFIGVPIFVKQDNLVGVLTAQPSRGDKSLLPDRTRFMEMVAQLLGQTVRLAHQIEQQQRDLADERDQLRRVVRGQYGFTNVIGHTEGMKKVFELVRQVAKWNTTVLIRGESGTGKELIANAIHYNSPRNSNNFIKVNCAALPDNLLESELFGHEKGAFSGAINQHKGRFERANSGTLFLDEIGDIPPAFQAKLLRVLQEGEFERVGGNRTLKVDVRIITATNIDLESKVEEGFFREDLYYRLNVMPINLPPLRERIEDIPDLTDFLISKLAKKQGRQLKLTSSAIRLLMRHPWSGNVRELENCLERAAILCESDTIDRAVINQTGIEESIPLDINTNETKVNLNNPNLDERERVIAALEQAGWVQAKAARLLNMTPRQIAYRIQRYKIKMRNI